MDHNGGKPELVGTCSLLLHSSQFRFFFPTRTGQFEVALKTLAARQGTKKYPLINSEKKVKDKNYDNSGTLTFHVVQVNFPREISLLTFGRETVVSTGVHARVQEARDAGAPPRGRDFQQQLAAAAEDGHQLRESAVRGE